MASPRTAYPNSHEAKSRSRAYSRAEVGQLLASADLSCERPYRKRTGEGHIQGSRRYRREHLRTALQSIVYKIFKGWPSGQKVELFAAVETYARHANRCERAMRYILRDLESEKIVVLKEASKRHSPRTYALNLERLRQLRRHSEQPDLVEFPARQSQQEKQHRAPVRGTQDPEGHPGSRKEREVRKLRLEVRARFQQYVRGVTEASPPEGGMASQLDPSDPRYMAPSAPDNARTRALMDCGVGSDKEAMQIGGLSIEDLLGPEQAEGP